MRGSNSAQPLGFQHTTKLAHHHLPSSIRFGRQDKAVQLRFTQQGYELSLIQGRSNSLRSSMFTSGQLRQATVEMLTVESGPIRLSFEDRHIVVRLDGKAWVRVPDILFMRLHSMASVGSGEGIDEA